MDNNNLLQDDDIKGKTHKSFGFKKNVAVPNNYFKFSIQDH